MVKSGVAPGNDQKFVSVSCHDGDAATGGSAENGPFTTVVTDHPEPLDNIRPTGWAATFLNQTNSEASVYVNVVCQHTE